MPWSTAASNNQGKRVCQLINSDDIAAQFLVFQARSGKPAEDARHSLGRGAHCHVDAAVGTVVSAHHFRVFVEPMHPADRRRRRDRGRSSAVRAPIAPRSPPARSAKSLAGQRRHRDRPSAVRPSAARRCLVEPVDLVPDLDQLVVGALDAEIGEDRLDVLGLRFARRRARCRAHAGSRRPPAPLRAWRGTPRSACVGRSEMKPTVSDRIAVPPCGRRIERIVGSSVANSMSAAITSARVRRLNSVDLPALV